MFASWLSSVVTRHPWRVVAVWLVALVALTTLAPGLQTSSDQTDFLPRSYESVRAQAAAQRAFGSGSVSALVVVDRADDSALTGADRDRVSVLAQELNHRRPAGVSAIRVPASGAISRDGRVALVSVAFAGGAGDSRISDAVGDLRRQATAALRGSPLNARMTGTPAQAADLEQAGSDAESIIGVATLVLILVLLTAIFRSPVAALVPLVIVALVGVTAVAIIGIASRVLGFEADKSVTSLLIVVLFGVGTDYIVFLLFRLRERLRAGDEPRVAVAQSVRHVGVTIASSAAVVIAAFMALLLSELGSNRALAPSLAISVAVMLCAALTLVPAILTLVGPRIFWPSRRWRTRPEGRVARRLAEQIVRRPARTTIVVSVLLAALAAPALALSTDYDQTSDLPASAESTQAARTLAAAFPNVSADPVGVYAVGGANSAGIQRLAAQLEAVRGVKAVAQPVVGRDGTVRLDVNLAARSATANRALDIVADGIRPVTSRSQAAPEVLVGGTTAALADVRSALDRDYRVVFGAAALAIMLIVALLLRSLVAPVVLLGAVAIGFAATLGVSVLAVQGVAGKPGLLFGLPLTLYAFVVAIGTDYNILVATRLREEDAERLTADQALERTVRRSLGPVAAAGTILAGTFAALMLTPLASLRELGLAVASGLLIMAFVVASVLVPSVAALLGRRLWWPAQRMPAPTAELETDALAAGQRG
jgi:RND superfamily putative drug exporter